MNIIALLTDFGLTDYFAGSVKASILDINPEANIVDISHNVPRGDVFLGAFSLLLSFRDFPKGTIFVTVIDPGVGSGRAAIAVKCGSYFFIGPDNGVLSLACEKNGVRASVRKLENKKFFRNSVSGTFHGRDIFGPVAAHLSKGADFEKLGPLQKTFLHCQIPSTIVKADKIQGIVAYIDHFGNCITSIEQSHLKKMSGRRIHISIKSKKLIPLCKCYNDVPEGNSLGVIGSAGFLEISVNCGNAAIDLNLKHGDSVDVAFI
jgi:S-adenosylmethionine hydrolase